MDGGDHTAFDASWGDACWRWILAFDSDVAATAHRYLDDELASVSAVLVAY
jgi:hypothetical protein